jgi:sugar lactone lactonase YvrE
VETFDGLDKSDIRLALSSDGRTLFFGTESKVQSLSLRSKKVTTICGADEEGYEDGIGEAARFSYLSDLVLSPDDKTLYVADFHNDMIRTVDVATGEVSTLAGSGERGSDDGYGAEASFSMPDGLALSPDGKFLFVGDGRSARVRKVDVESGEVTTLAGSGKKGMKDGVGRAASFRRPSGLAMSVDGETLFVADGKNHRIRKVDVATGTVSTLAGSGAVGSRDGPAHAATFKYPDGLAMSPGGKWLFVSDFDDCRIRTVNVTTGRVSTLAGSGRKGSRNGMGQAASFVCPGSLSVAPDDRTLIVAEHDDQGSIRTIAIAEAPPPSSIVVPRSTYVEDIARTMSGDSDLPEGKVTFVVGPEGRERRFRNLSKANLCVRSEYFFAMFSGGMAESRRERDEEIRVPDADPRAFRSLIDYIVKDAVKFGAGSPDDINHAFDVLVLARKHRMVRLERLTMLALSSLRMMTPESAVPLLEASCGSDEAGDERLFDEYRRFVLDHGPAVLEAGGLDQLRELDVAKEMLRDTIQEIQRLRVKCGEAVDGEPEPSPRPRKRRRR